MPLLTRLEFGAILNHKGVIVQGRCQVFELVIMKRLIGISPRY